MVFNDFTIVLTIALHWQYGVSDTDRSFIANVSDSCVVVQKELPLRGGHKEQLPCRDAVSWDCQAPGAESVSWRLASAGAALAVAALAVWASAGSGFGCSGLGCSGFGCKGFDRRVLT